MEIGEKLRKFRKQRKFTQEDMAGALSITQRAYSKIENDEVKVKLDRLGQIASILNIDARSLLPDTTTNYCENVTHSQIGNGRVINHTSENEKILYNKIIDRQQEEIKYLKGIISSINN